MKKQNQIERTNSGSGGRPQAKKRPIRVRTGPLVWSEAAFNRADKAGRFVLIEYNASQHAAQLASRGYRISFRHVLRLATGEQVRAMRGCAPLYTTSHQPDDGGRRAPTTLTLLRGQGPGGRDYAWMKNARRLIAAEIFRRRMLLAQAFRDIAYIQSRGTKRQIQLLDHGLNLIAHGNLAEVKRLMVKVHGAQGKRGAAVGLA